LRFFPYTVLILSSSTPSRSSGLPLQECPHRDSHPARRTSVLPPSLPSLFKAIPYFETRPAVIAFCTISECTGVLAQTLSRCECSLVRPPFSLFPLDLLLPLQWREVIVSTGQLWPSKYGAVLVIVHCPPPGKTFCPPLSLRPATP